MSDDPRVALIDAIYRIAQRGGRVIDDAPRLAPAKHDDEWREVTHDPDAIAALDAATAELLQAIIAGKIGVKGKRDGDGWRLETISPDDFPKSLVGPLAVASISQILGEAGPYLDISASSQVTDGKRVFWSDLVVDGAELERFLTNDPVSKSPKRKATKPAALAEILRNRWPERPELTINEIDKIIRADARTIGNYSLRTLKTAVGIAWPRDRVQNGAN